MDQLPSSRELIYPTSRNPATHAARPPRHRPGEKFLKGPVPLNWLARASRLPGKSLNVAVALWFLVGLMRRRTVPLSNAVLEPFGVNRYAKYRALQWLEGAGLISLQQSLGQSVLVTILDLEAAE